MSEPAGEAGSGPLNQTLNQQVSVPEGAEQHPQGDAQNHGDAQQQGDGQLAAALAARAKMERLLASPHPFSHDDGSPDPALATALERTDLPRHEWLDGVVDALEHGRVLVPVAAHSVRRPPAALVLGGGTTVPEHEVHTATPEQDAATLAINLPDGHVALPIFSSAAAMAAWRADVRPVPVTPLQAAQVAYERTDQLWVLDPGTRDLRLPRPALCAIAGGEDWVPSWRSEPIQDEVRSQLQMVDGVAGVAFAPGQSAELRVLIAVDAAPGPQGAASAAATLDGCQRIMVNPAWGELIDTIELCPVRA